jgi:hypothetical protein
VFSIYVGRQGLPKSAILRPDPEGYVAVVVEPGHYNLGTIVIRGVLGTWTVWPDPIPSIHVDSSDRVVSFGTIRIQFREISRQEPLGSVTIGNTVYSRSRIDLEKGANDTSEFTLTVDRDKDLAAEGVRARLGGGEFPVSFRPPLFLPRRK